MKRPPLGHGELAVAVRASHAASGFSGVVVARCPASASPAVGSEVFGTLPPGYCPGQVAVCRGLLLACKPAALSHAEAALLASVGAIALCAARLIGARPRQRVMVTGAGSEVGALAVQIARVGGNHVTGVCRERDVPLVWEIGADEVLSAERRLGSTAPFAAVIDTDGSVSPETAASLLEADGRLVAVRGRLLRMWTARGLPIAMQHVGKTDGADLYDLAGLVERHGVFPIRTR